MVRIRSQLLVANSLKKTQFNAFQSGPGSLAVSKLLLPETEQSSCVRVEDLEFEAAYDCFFFVKFIITFFL